MKKRVTIALVAGAIALVAGACGGSDEASVGAAEPATESAIESATDAATDSATDSASAPSTEATTSSVATSAAPTSPAPTSPVELTTVTLGAVPTLDLGLLQVATDQGFFAEVGIELEITNVDSGPNVVTGVVAGQYDLGFTAYAPPLLALAGGQPLQVVSNVGVVGPDGQNGGVLVRKDSGITGFADLAGKKVASNAPRSLLSLTLPAAITADGGDGASIEIVPLPFNEIAGAVESGQVDAGVTLEPFQSKALADSPDLVNLGDTIAIALPEGSPSGLVFTSADIYGAKGDLIAAFQAAFAKAVEYANAHPDEVKAAGAPLAGLDPAVAAGLPLATYDTAIDAAALQPLVDLMIEYQWIEQAPDLSAFVSSAG